MQLDPNMNILKTDRIGIADFSCCPGSSMARPTSPSPPRPPVIRPFLHSLIQSAMIVETWVLGAEGETQSTLITLPIPLLFLPADHRAPASPLLMLTEPAYVPSSLSPPQCHLLTVPPHCPLLSDHPQCHLLTVSSSLTPPH